MSVIQQNDVQRIFTPSHSLLSQVDITSNNFVLTLKVTAVDSSRASVNPEEQQQQQTASDSSSVISRTKATTVRRYLSELD